MKVSDAVFHFLKFLRENPAEILALLAAIGVLWWYFNQDAATIGLFVAAIALLLNWGKLKEDVKLREVQSMYEFYKDIDSISREIFDLEAQGKNNAKTKTKIKRLDSVLFNRIELFAFLINRNLIGSTAVEFFKDAIVDWYEGIFLKHASEKEKTNDKYYIEFKILYHKLKCNSLQ